MKKLLFFGLLSISIITGCKTQIYSIGTSEAEFKAHTKGHLTLVEQTERTTVYRKYYVSLGGLNDDDGMYYYFTDGKLVRMDRTGPNANVIIQQTGI